MFDSKALKKHLTLRKSGYHLAFANHLLVKQKVLRHQSDQLPAKTGVYFFADKRDRILYVGKSIHIRNRIKQHLSDSGTGHHSRHLRLIANTAAFSWIETHSEIIALLLEDELIKALQPPFNVRQNEFRRYLYLALSNESFPRLLQLDAEQREDYQSYGPFKDSWRSAEFVDMIHSWFPLRKCTTPAPRLQCSYYDIQSCCGPCRNAISTQEYQKIASEVRTVLEASNPQWIKKLDDAMQKASQNRQYEKAAEIHSQIQLYRRYARRAHFIENFKTGDLWIRESECPSGEFLFRKGVLENNNYLFMLSALTVESVDKTESADNNAMLVDRALVVLSWLNKSKSEYRFL